MALDTQTPGSQSNNLNHWFCPSEPLQTHGTTCAQHRSSPQVPKQLQLSDPSAERADSIRRPSSTANSFGSQSVGICLNKDDFVPAFENSDGPFQLEHIETIGHKRTVLPDATMSVKPFAVTQVSCDEPLSYEQKDKEINTAEQEINNNRQSFHSTSHLLGSFDDRDSRDFKQTALIHRSTNTSYQKPRTTAEQSCSSLTGGVGVSEDASNEVAILRHRRQVFRWACFVLPLRPSSLVGFFVCQELCS